MAYWFTSARMAATAASLSSSGAGKLGKPWARLMAPCSLASRVIPRMTDSVKPWVRRAVCITLQGNNHKLKRELGHRGHKKHKSESHPPRLLCAFCVDRK